MNSRVRAWCFTMNNPTAEEDTVLFHIYSEGIVKYLVFAYEEGEQGTPHIQGYIYFKNQQYGNKVRLLLPKCHIEVSHGTPEENRNYIVGPYDKDGKTKPYNVDHWEYGELPVKGKATFDKVRIAMMDPQSNIQLYTQYRKAYREIQSLSIDLDKERKFQIIYRSDMYTLAKQHIKDGLSVSTDINMYNGEQVLFVDIAVGDQKMIVLTDKLLQWKNGLPPMIKYGYEHIRLDPDIMYIMASDYTRQDPFFQQFV